jgi:hypothetical protein
MPLINQTSAIEQRVSGTVRVGEPSCGMVIGFDDGLADATAWCRRGTDRPADGDVMALRATFARG